MEEIQIPDLPKTFKQFRALRDKLAGTPAGAATLLLVALIIYMQDEEFGLQCLPFVVDKSRLHGWQLRDTELNAIQAALTGYEYILHSYIAGTSPENGYRLPDPPYTFTFEYVPRSNPASGRFRILAISSGSNRGREITLMLNRDTGFWMAQKWPAILMDVKATE